MVFYWDNSQKKLWFGTRKFLCSLPETALEKDKYLADHPMKWAPSDWNQTGEWLHWDATQVPFGGIPEPFLQQARQTFAP